MLWFRRSPGQARGRAALSYHALRDPSDERFSGAASRAIDLHRAQERKGSGIPYVAHVLGVASPMMESGGHEDEAIAELLHDSAGDLTTVDFTASRGSTH